MPTIFETPFPSCLRSTHTEEPGHIYDTKFKLNGKAVPGRNVHIIDGLPRGTTAASATVEEDIEPPRPRSPGAFFETKHARLYEGGTKCRIEFEMNWIAPLSTVVHLTYGLE
eukprot:GHVO01003872.1.p1 GENE.GHVO01003872.1~~GHVO01003872.1.p1  ORF type:complete len:112 (+),score=13.77 GHVO01003872.1:37-372(+)